MTLWFIVLATALPSLLMSYFLVGWVRLGAERLGLLDRPGVRKVHTTPIPLGGGIGIWGATVLTFAMGTIVAF